ncbi:hypothetical protein VL20_3274 [Microcystis panniformis FACHB-1757]|uniref:Uncharacterized protein n=1 Tax=Microcystis panniformis FACHB-1757 TaxID=1638788 RepID=A0A0K1S2A6_9CHRO|nr:hypothetical protein VL20_3274 [Microcystis panniformis FACHB-1757]
METGNALILTSINFSTNDLASRFPNPHSAIINRSQKYIGALIILCVFCQKNFFFAIKLHKKKIIVVGEIDSFTRLN